MKAAFSFARLEAAALLQSAYSAHHVRAFENFHQLVEDTLIILGPGLKIFFQYELRFADCLKGQLLISHAFSPPQLLALKEEEKIKTLLGTIPAFLRDSINFCFTTGCDLGYTASMGTF